MKIYQANISELGTLPPDWVDAILSLVEAKSRARWFDDAAPTARETLAPGEGIKSWVVDGNQVGEQAPWLVGLYETELCELAAQHLGRDVVIGKVPKSNVNINKISGLGGRFEKHVDTNHLTALLFVTTLAENDGGALCFEGDDGLHSIQPEVGKIIFVDARKLPHYVTPLRRDLDRVVVVMNYFFADEPYDRPDYIDKFIYGGIE